MVVRSSTAGSVGAMVVAVLVGTTGSAFALKPGTHAAITSASCLAAGLPNDFCRRIATEDYNTDSREWADLRAHAQIDAGETACVAADRTAARQYELGAQLRELLASVRVEASWDNVGMASAAVGRALHTAQDNCAHHGMPNPQHAWFSISDFCTNTTLSPDIQDDAKACARTETDAIIALVAAAVRSRGLEPWVGAGSCPPAPETTEGAQRTEICSQRFLPGPIDGCSFLGQAKDWDGIDRTWENGVVSAALREAFAAGLAGEAMIAPICAGNESVLSPAVSQPAVNVGVTAPTCAKAKLLCLGKADGAENPFDDEDPSPDATLDETGGCSTGTGSGDAALLVIAGAVIAARRRRNP